MATELLNGGATPEPIDEAVLQECPRDGKGQRGKHKFEWEPRWYFMAEPKQICMNCGQERQKQI